MATEKWDFDLVHSSINFWVRHMMVSKVHGRFTKWTRTIEMDEGSFAMSSNRSSALDGTSRRPFVWFVPSWAARVRHRAKCQSLRAMGSAHDTRE